MAWIAGCPRAADPKIDRSHSDQRFGLRQDQAGLDGRGRRCHLLRQAIALECIEDYEALQKRDRPRLVTGLRRTPPFIVGLEAIGLDDGRAALAFTHIPAETQGLAEGRVT